MIYVAMVRCRDPGSWQHTGDMYPVTRWQPTPTPRMSWVPDPNPVPVYKPYGGRVAHLYDTPAKAKRYAGKLGYVLEVDLDHLPRVFEETASIAEQFQDAEALAVFHMERAAALKARLGEDYR